MTYIPPKGNFLWITDRMEREFVEDAYRALRLTPGAEEWLRTAEPPEGKGFMWWDHPMVAALKANIGEGHSGSSAAFTLRTAQEMAQKGWDIWAVETLLAQLKRAHSASSRT